MAKKMANDCGSMLIQIRDIALSYLVLEYPRIWLFFQNATFTFSHAKEDSFYEADDVFQF